MATFWLSDDDSNTLIIDDNFLKINIGPVMRNFTAANYLASNGGRVKGFGKINTRKITMSHKNKVESGDINWFNSRRNAINIWFMRARYRNVYFNIRNGEDTKTYQTKVYAKGIGGDEATSLKIASERTLEFFSDTGYFENITESTGSQAITKSLDTDVVVTNSSTVDTPITLDFTPSASCTLIQYIISDQYGFRLQGGFNSGEVVSIDTSDGTFSIDGVEQDYSQYLTSGSLFNIDPDQNTITVFADSAGTLDYSYNERFV